MCFPSILMFSFSPILHSVLTKAILSPSASVRSCIMKILEMLGSLAHNLERQRELGLSCELVILEGDKSQPMCPSVNYFQESLGHPDRPWGDSCVFSLPVEFQSGLEYKTYLSLGCPGFASPRNLPQRALNTLSPPECPLKSSVLSWIFRVAFPIIDLLFLVPKTHRPHSFLANLG